MSATLVWWGAWLASPVAAQSVAVLGSASSPGANPIVADLLRCTGEFEVVDTIDTSRETPTLRTLQNYHALLVWGDDRPADAVALGDVLADYHDQGGGVVLALASYSSGSNVRGRWRDQGLTPVTESDMVAGGRDLGLRALPGFA
jgi:hypothetical protein